jgi:two-component system, cell cycle sensor histidine kinase and response regulator CckA
MQEKDKKPLGAQQVLESSSRIESGSGPLCPDDLPTFEIEDWHDAPRPLSVSEGSTETIDLASLLTKDVSTTGSFDIRGEIWTTTFGKVLQAIPIPAFLIDTGYNVLQANQACSKISPAYETVLGAPFSGLLAVPLGRDRIQTLIEEVFAARKTRVGETLLQIGDRKIWARMTLRSVRIMQDRFALALIEDLTNERKQLQVNERLRRDLERRVEERTATLMEANERLRIEVDQRKRAEQSLRENQDQLKAVLEHLPDLLWMKDRRGTFQLVNTACAQACGKKTPKEMIGKSDWEVWPKELAEKYRSDDRAVFESRRSQLVDEPMMSNGAMKWFEIFRTPLLDEHGEIVGTVGSARDITERKRAEQALRDSEEKYRNILETIADGYHEVDLAGNLTLVNDSLCEIMGYARSELLNMNYCELMDEANARRTSQAYAEVYRTGNANTGFDCEIIRKDGTKRKVSVSITLKQDSAHQPTGFRGVFRDVTEHRRLEEQLQQASKMEAIGRLAGGIAHDFNNLLTAVIGYANLVLPDIPKDDVKHERVAQIAHAADRAAALTRQLLAFSRKQVLDVKVININDVIQGMEEMLRRLIGEDVELVTQYRSSLGLVKADPGQIEQILLNLAVNARDAMPRGGKLTIETTNVLMDENFRRTHPEAEADLYVMFAVRDTGVGMDSETMAHMFDPFFTTKEKGLGTGLGLATVYGSVTQHQGHVVVESQPGNGASFKVYLPLVEEDLDATVATQVQDLKLDGTETILVVEDEGAVRNLVCQALEMLGYSTLPARDPQQAIEISTSHDGPIHLLLSDVVLPQMDGRTLFNSISTARPDMKVLYVSGYTEDFIVHHGVLDRGVHFLAKPFAVETLASKVREILDESPHAL